MEYLLLWQRACLGAVLQHERQLVWRKPHAAQDMLEHCVGRANCNGTVATSGLDRSSAGRLHARAGWCYFGSDVVVPGACPRLSRLAIKRNAPSVPAGSWRQRPRPM